jgi:hypothetical protein
MLTGYINYIILFPFFFPDGGQESSMALDTLSGCRHLSSRRAEIQPGDRIGMRFKVK